MKIIAFSLWGYDPKYLQGALRNAELAQEIYPGWICRFYVGTNTPFGIIRRLQKYKNTQIVEMNEIGDWRGMFWRFAPAAEKGVEVMVSRDTDSRLNWRERAAVDQWLDSDKGFHIMRDHPYHKFPVLGGMWGAKTNTVPNMKELIANWDQRDEYGTDYKFFESVILPLISDNVMIHDEFFDGQPFPTPRSGHEFVGQVFDENENTVQEHVEALKFHV